MPAEPADRYPLAPPQRGVLFHALSTPGSTRYVEQRRYRLEGDLDPAAFRAAWEVACERHPVLRTGFDWQAGSPEQEVVAAVELPLAVTDWRDLPPPEQGERARQLAADEWEQGFDLARPPLFRLHLVRLADRAWRLLWTYHHLILDRDSAGLVLREVATTYNADRRGQRPDLPPAPAYRDFVAWAGEQDVTAAEEHWTAALAGVTEPTPLGITLPAGSGAATAPHQRVDHPVPPELATRLDRFACDHQLTLDTLLLGAWAVVLGRYCGLDDVMFGVTSARSGTLPGLDRMVGLMINTLPARVRLDWDRPVVEWLVRVQMERARAGEFALTPLDRVRGWSQVPAGRRLFDSVLVTTDPPVTGRHGTWRLGDARLVAESAVQQTEDPLTLTARAGDGLVLEATFDAGALDARLVEPLLRHWAAALAGLVTAPVPGQVQVLGADEHADLSRRAGPRESFPGAEPPPARFAAWAGRLPDRIALSDGDEHLSYRELRTRAARLAHRLIGLGVGPGTLVGICLPRGADLVTAVLAVACAGGGSVPVDHQDPDARVRAVLTDAGVAVLLTHRDRAGLGHGDAGPAATLCLDDAVERSRLMGLPAELPPLAAGGPDVAYVIYTSGSTGTPKGVIVEHRQVARLFEATRSWFGFGPDDVWALFHSVAFDFSVWELWGALTTGGRLVVVPGEHTRDPARFRELLLAEQVTVLNQTPSSFRTLLHADLTATTSPSPYRLRWVIFGGERLEVTSLRPWLARYGDQQPGLVNMYGITETTVHVTYRRIGVADLDRPVASLIGEPLGDLAVRLVDPRGWLVPVGVPGEMLVGGAGVARGYLHRPELTAQRFVAELADGELAEDGLAEDGQRRWYRTGDRARWLPEGGLEFLGRVDDQIKVRGYRIEPGEIERALTGHPHIREAVVAARPTGVDGHHRLVAYLVPAPDTGLSWPAVRGWLADRLPEHLLPATAVSLERLPLTPNGKVDRTALPEPGPARPDHEPDPVAPRTGIEQVLAEVMAEVLGLERVGVTDNFFALGGDSILTIQAASRARQRGVVITPAQLFSHQSVAELAPVAEPVAKGAGPEQGEVTGEVPVTPVQAWFSRLALPHPGHWNLPVLLVARQPVQVARLGRALAALVAHHDLLRLRVAAAGDRPRHRIVPVPEHGPIPVEEFDCAAAGRDGLRARVDQLARHVQGGLDLARGPLLRAAVFRAPPGEPDRVLLVAHHLVVDAVSWRILLEDLDTAYRHLAEGAPVRLPPKTTDFGWWARHLVERAGSGQVAQEVASWLAALPGAARQAPALPVDGDRHAPNLEGGCEIAEVMLDRSRTRALLTAANRAYRTKTEELLLAALAQAATGWTGGGRLLVDVEGHGRDSAMEACDLSRTVGWFTTLTPTWLDLAGIDAHDPAQVIRVVKEQLRAIPGRGAPYGLARWLRDDELARQLSELPRAQISFNHLGGIDQAAEAHGQFALAPEPATGHRHPANPRPYLIDVVTAVREGRLRVYLTYSARHHTRDTVERLAAGYLDSLCSLLDHCGSPGAGGPTPSDFPLARVDQPQLDQLAERHGAVANLYPLTPLQRGMLFHTLANPHSGVYFEQFSIELDGDVDVAALTGAWAALHERHAVLRAAVAWQGLADPHLVIRERVEVPLARHDWCHLTGAEQAARLDELLARDRIEGFDLTSAPLTRLHLVQLGQRRWTMVWSHHHLLLDRWSIARLIQEIFDTYHAIRAGDWTPAPPPRPFRDYAAYLAGRDMSGAPAYWRRVLDGLTRPTPLGVDRPAVRAGRLDADYARLGRRLSRDGSEAVRRFVRDQRLTLDTVLHGAWALVLAHRSGLDDVVFAVTSSGRPPELAGVEEMIGLFINTFPARVRIDRDQPVGAWLAGLLRDQVRAREFEHTPLEQIRGWSAVPPDQPLFESGRALVNFPWDASRYRTGDLAITSTRTFEQASFALSFVVVPEEEVLLQLWYDVLRFTPESADHLVRAAEALILALVADPVRAVGEVLAGIEPPTRQGVPERAALPELVAYWAERQPDRVAVTDGDRSLTYRELSRRAGQVAGWLRDLGAGPGMRVGVALTDPVEQVVATLGVAAAAAVCVPLPAGPELRGWPDRPDLGLSMCLLPAGPEQAERSELAERSKPRLVAYPPADLADRPTTPAHSPPESDSVAVLAWWPPVPDLAGGVELTHGELATLAHQDGITPADVVAHLAERGGAVAAWEIWAALANGATLAAGPVDAVPPGVTVLTLPARHLTRLLDQRPEALAGARVLLVRGELAAPYARRLRVRLPALTLVPAAGRDAGWLARRLRTLPGVAEAVVQPASGHRLTAYLVPDIGELADGGALANRLADRHLARWRSHPAPDRDPPRWRELLPDLTGEGEPPPARVVVSSSAADLANLGPGGADVVLLHSAVHQFPGPWYLDRVLAAALRVATRAVVVTGVGHLGLREACHVAEQLHRSVDLLPVGELSARVTRSLAEERELLVHPAYFTGFAASHPDVGGVDLLPSHDPSGPARFRYHAVLRLVPAAVPTGITWYDWSRDVLSPDEIAWLLRHAVDDLVGVTGVPDARVAVDLAAARLLAGAADIATAGELRLAAAEAAAGMDPAQLGALGRHHGWSATVGLATDPGHLTVVFQRGDTPAALPPDTADPGGIPDLGVTPPRHHLTTLPTRFALVAEVERQARELLDRALPGDDSIRVVVLDELPRTAGGQVDEAALSPALPAAGGPVPVAAVPPRTGVELRLARIWQRVLGAAPTDVRASFFDLGGDSMLAIRLIDEVSRELGRQLPLAVLLREPTIEAMAAAAQEEPGPWSPLVEITSGQGTPFFCAHPAGGTVLCYGELARLAGPRPFCALQARGVEGGDPPDDDISIMAARYLAAVRDRRPAGPYLLGGWSMGGLVAYEMAQQLAAAGERVSRLILIDTPTPDLVGELPDQAAALARLLDGVIPVDLDRLREMPVEQRLRHVLAEAERVGMVPAGMDPDRAGHLFAVYAAHVEAVRGYRPRPYAGPVTLLRATDSGVSAPDYGWSGLLTGPWQVVDVPGTHESVVWPPNVQRLAEVLHDELSAGDAVASGG
jgi:amino acid adenylation domain-containing protein/non-ribosomal peptide synthase protein (TIGR01720 family)